MYYPVFHRKFHGCLLTFLVFLSLVFQGNSFADSSMPAKYDQELTTKVEKSIQPRISVLTPRDVNNFPSGLRNQINLSSSSGLASTSPLTKDEKMGKPNKIHAMGLIPSQPTTPPAAGKVLEQINSDRRARAAQLKPGEKPILLESPPSADNSAGLPPVGDQGAQGSCVS